MGQIKNIKLHIVTDIKYYQETMEVINENVAMLSNAEVFQLLEKEKLIEHNCTNVATIAYETIRELLTALQPYDFTKAEKLQLLNLRPTSIVEMQLIVEELDERLKTEEELQKLIDLIEEKLPLPEAEET